MAHYALSDVQVLTMPVRRFWLLSESIDRMKASDDIRAIRVAAAVLGQDAYKQTLEALSTAVGNVAVRAIERDEDGVARFKKSLTMGR
ncbi:MAG: hypothetical protein ACXWT0_01630 [Methylobacter sp.]